MIRSLSDLVWLAIHDSLAITVHRPPSRATTLTLTRLPAGLVRTFGVSA